MLTLQSMVFYNAHFMTLELHEAIKLKMRLYLQHPEGCALIRAWTLSL
jgi:hypothetical protein